MDLLKAKLVAEAAAKQQSEDYVIVQVRNGEWMVERKLFVLEDARGRMLYPANKRKMIVTPQGEWRAMA